MKVNRDIKYISLVVALASLLIIGAAWPVLAAEDQKRDVWEWTKKNLNPTWMEWGEKYWPTKPVRGGIYRSASGAYVGMLNPNHWPVTDWGVIGLFYEGITAYDGSYNQQVTWLMESWEFITPTELIMKLKPGVHYHDGTPFNADSLKYTFDWIGDKKNGAWTRGMQRDIKSLEVVDEYTLRWRTHKPWGNFPLGFFAFQLSKKALMGDVALREADALKKKVKKAEKNLAKAEKKVKAAAAGEAAEKARAKVEKEKVKLAKIKKQAEEAAAKIKGHVKTDQHPVGTGPFMFDEARAGNYIKAKRNPNWWFGKSIGRPEMPYFDGIKVTVIPDPSIQLANLRAGKIDVMYISKAQYSMLKDDPNFYVHVFPSNHTVGMIFNHTGPAKDIRVRKAVAHAIDRKALIVGTQFGLAREASCYFPGDHWAHNPDLKPVSFDPELSKRLLADAGYAKGLIMKGTSGNSASASALAEAIKAMLAKVGIDWKVEAVDSVSGADRLKNLEFDVSMWTAGYIQDPDSIAWYYLPAGAWNYGRLKDEAAIPIILAAKGEIEFEKRREMYRQIEETIYNNYDDVWLWWEKSAVAYRKVVQGWNNKMYIENRTWYTSSHPMWFKDGHP